MLKRILIFALSFSVLSQSCARAAQLYITQDPPPASASSPHIFNAPQPEPESTPAPSPATPPVYPSYAPQASAPQPVCSQSDQQAILDLQKMQQDMIKSIKAKKADKHTADFYRDPANLAAMMQLYQRCSDFYIKLIGFDASQYNQNYPSDPWAAFRASPKIRN